MSASKPVSIARLKITLDMIEPAIWRRVEIPLSASLAELHRVIQAVMLFEDYHLYQFEIGPRRKETLYGIPQPDMDFMDIEDARKTSLSDLTEAGVKKFVYTYDFGDDWRHIVQVEAVAEADPEIAYPRLTGGARRAPREDCGGPPGFMDFIDALADSSHPDHAEKKEWYGRAFNAEDMMEPKIKSRLAKLVTRKKTPGKTAKPRKAVRQWVRIAPKGEKA